MASPPLLLAGLAATALGLFAHIWGGGDGRALVLDIVASWLGFALGQALGEVIALRFLEVGSVFLLTGFLGSAIALVTTRFLASGKLRRIEKM